MASPPQITHPNPENMELKEQFLHLKLRIKLLNGKIERKNHQEFLASQSHTHNPAWGCVTRPIGADLAIGYNKADFTFDKTGLHSFEEQDTLLKISKVRFLNNSKKVHCSNEIQLFQNTH